MKHTPLIALTLIAATAIFGACSENDSDAPSAVPFGSTIRFTATSSPLGRAVNDPYTTSSLDTFTVYAYRTGTTVPYMDSITVVRSASGEWTYSPEKYWPDTTLNFYAYAPAGWVGAAGPLSPVEYDNVLADHDIIYSTVAGAGQPASGQSGQVSFNFKHALSRATFNLASTDTLLEVRMAFLSVHGLYTHGTFAFPTATGDAGTWSALTNRRFHLLYHSISQDDYVTLTSTPTEYYTPGVHMQYFLPQSLDGDTTDYAEVNFQIFDRKSGAQVWPNENTPAANITPSTTDNIGHLQFKLATDTVTEWKAGHHYIYNIFINSAPGLDPIKFGSPTVENFVTVQVTEP